jgi:hypothetical protein
MSPAKEPCKQHTRPTKEPSWRTSLQARLRDAIPTRELDITRLRLRLLPGNVQEMDSITKLDAAHNELVALPLDIGQQARFSQPYTLHFAPYTLHPKLWTLKSTAYTLHSTIHYSVVTID